MGNNCRWGDKTLKTSLADPIANKRAEDKRQDHRHDPIVVLLTLDGMNSLDEVLLDFLSPVGRVTRKLGFRPRARFVRPLSHLDLYRQKSEICLYS